MATLGDDSRRLQRRIGRGARPARTKTRWLVAVMAMAAALAACGGGDGADLIADLEDQIADLEAELDRAASSTTSVSEVGRDTTSTAATASSTTAHEKSRFDTGTTTTHSVPPPSIDLRQQWAPNEFGGGQLQGVYDGAATYTIWCREEHGCSPDQQILVEDDFLEFGVWGYDVVANELVIPEVSSPGAGLQLHIGPGYAELPQFTLTEQSLRLEPSQRYPWDIDLTIRRDQNGDTIVQGTISRFELLATGELQELWIMHAMTVTLMD